MLNMHVLCTCSASTDCETLVLCSSFLVLKFLACAVAHAHGNTQSARQSECDGIHRHNGCSDAAAYAVIGSSDTHRDMYYVYLPLSLTL
jgi:hypothetical protein